MSSEVIKCILDWESGEDHTVGEYKKAQLELKELEAEVKRQNSLIKTIEFDCDDNGTTFKQYRKKIRAAIAAYKRGCDDYYITDTCSSCQENKQRLDDMSKARCEADIKVAEREAENKRLRHCLEKAVQLAEIACDWNLCEVEIDEDMVSTYTLKEGFEQALKGGK